MIKNSQIISLVTKNNPLEVVLKAITVGGPREDSTRIGIRVL